MYSIYEIIYMYMYNNTCISIHVLVYNSGIYCYIHVHVCIGNTYLVYSINVIYSVYVIMDVLVYMYTIY